MKVKNKVVRKPITAEQYKILLRDFLAINAVAGIMAFGTFVVMLLQRFDIIPPMPCMVHDVLHIYCPGCGGTRALFAMLKGHFLQSLYYNPVILSGTLLVLYYEIGVIITLLKKNGKSYFYRKGTFAYLYIVFIVVFAIVRNYRLIAFGIDPLGDFL